MTQSWSDFSVVEKIPDPQTHSYLGEAPFTPLHIWVMGPDWVVATADLADTEPVVATWRPDAFFESPDLADTGQIIATWRPADEFPDPAEPGVVTSRMADGSLLHSLTRPRTAAEQSDIDNDVDAVLADAGLPPRPPGFNWYVKMPEDEIAKFWEYVGYVDVGWSDKFVQRGDNYYAFAYRAMQVKLPRALERIATSRVP